MLQITAGIIIANIGSLGLMYAVMAAVATNSHTQGGHLKKEMAAKNKTPSMLPKIFTE
jgi:hypothetical protein